MTKYTHCSYNPGGYDQIYLKIWVDMAKYTYMFRVYMTEYTHIIRIWPNILKQSGWI